MIFMGRVIPVTTPGVKPCFQETFLPADVLPCSPALKPRTLPPLNLQTGSNTGPRRKAGRCLCADSSLVCSPIGSSSVARPGRISGARAASAVADEHFTGHLLHHAFQLQTQERDRYCGTGQPAVANHFV